MQRCGAERHGSAPSLGRLRSWWDELKGLCQLKRFRDSTAGRRAPGRDRADTVRSYRVGSCRRSDTSRPCRCKSPCPPLARSLPLGLQASGPGERQHCRGHSAATEGTGTECGARPPPAAGEGGSTGWVGGTGCLQGPHACSRHRRLGEARSDSASRESPGPRRGAAPHRCLSARGAAGRGRCAAGPGTGAAGGQ